MHGRKFVHGNEAGNLQGGSLGHDRTHLCLPVMRNGKRIALATFPFPEAGGKGDLESLAGY